MIRCGLLAMALAGSALQTSAATFERAGPIQTDPGAGCSIQLEGTIAPGDADALAQLLDQEIAQIENYPDFQIEKQIVLCLESPGGSFVEALRLAELVYDRAVTTRISADGTCLSACAIVFMGGNLDTRSGGGWVASRYMHSSARLGFHAPALVLPEGDFTREDVQRAYGVAIQATGLILGKATDLRLAQPLLTAMFNHVGDDFHYVETLDHAAVYGIDLYGYGAPAFTPDASNAACWNAYRWEYLAGDAPGTLADFTAMTDWFERDGNSVVFAPFDGYAFCDHMIVALGGGDRDHLRQSQFNDMTQAFLDRYWPAWIRLPGPSPLTSLPDGALRDF